ncbi:gamma-tubulin complex component [Cyclospora cayetanensis]|uniref:Gamma-tubulin complex component n=1 Tax=Cyclospora cayetanensis TaxID=88456 RepID=A0A1D3CRQ0_9EIME|nr:gamma-tubulin complex component [Cyclospora cayetanensis]
MERAGIRHCPPSIMRLPAALLSPHPWDATAAAAEVWGGCSIAALLEQHGLAAAAAAVPPPPPLPMEDQQDLLLLQQPPGRADNNRSSVPEAAVVAAVNWLPQQLAADWPLLPHATRERLLLEELLSLLLGVDGVLLRVVQQPADEAQHQSVALQQQQDALLLLRSFDSSRCCLPALPRFSVWLHPLLQQEAGGSSGGLQCLLRQLAAAAADIRLLLHAQQVAGCRTEEIGAVGSAFFSGIGDVLSELGFRVCADWTEQTRDPLSEDGAGNSGALSGVFWLLLLPLALLLCLKSFQSPTGVCGLYCRTSAAVSFALSSVPAAGGLACWPWEWQERFTVEWSAVPAVLRAFAPQILQVGRSLRLLRDYLSRFFAAAGGESSSSALLQPEALSAALPAAAGEASAAVYALLRSPFVLGDPDAAAAEMPAGAQGFVGVLKGLRALCLGGRGDVFAAFLGSLCDDLSLSLHPIASLSEATQLLHRAATKPQLYAQLLAAPRGSQQQLLQHPLDFGPTAAAAAFGKPSAGPRLARPPQDKGSLVLPAIAEIALMC